MDLETKAQLISIGTVQIKEPLPGTRPSTSGPGAGEQSIFFRSGRRIVRLSVVERSKLQLERRGDWASILLEGREVASGELVQPLLHCPEQAYITVCERCIYDCKFCAVPRLQGGVKPRDQVFRMVEEASRTGSLRAISLTSGVEVSREHEGRRVAQIVRDLRGFGVPIGVSVSPFPGVSRMLKEAGACEVKYNLETADPDLFSRVCPGISFQGIMDALEEAVEVFGRNRVFSNIIVGLGESESALREAIDGLAEMGVLPVLRAVYPHPLRLGEVEMRRPGAQRLLSLAIHLRSALDRNHLSGDLAMTGCYLCTGCDLAPGRDL